MKHEDDKQLRADIIQAAKENIKKDKYVPVKWLMEAKFGIKDDNFAFIIACEMVSTNEYRLIDVPHNKEDIGVMKNEWQKAHPYKYAALLGIIGLAFSIMAGIFIELTRMWIQYITTCHSIHP
jgi:hypothetical protein